MNRITRHVLYTKKDDLAPSLAPHKEHKEHKGDKGNHVLPEISDMDLLRTWCISSAGFSHFAKKPWLY